MCVTGNKLESRLWTQNTQSRSRFEPKETRKSCKTDACIEKIECISYMIYKHLKLYK